MSTTLQYTLSLQDQISAKLQKIGISSDNALNKFANLQVQSKKTSQLLKDMGGSVGSLREKLNLLKAEKEWIPQSNLTAIRKYNTEIKNLEKEITKLDTINGSAFKRNLKDAINNLPFAELVTNPVAQAGVALFQSAKMAVEFDEGMAKINTTAQLNSEQLSFLKNDLMNLGREAGADLAKVPEGFEKILSQTGDVALSQDILKASLKGSKAGFTDLETVTSAVAKTLSLVGKENTNAQEVLDTLFAAKRVGAGEFKDFATYVPGLVASGQALGKGFKETAGVFAFMTGKGQSAEASAMLIQNAYTALGKTKITDGLAKSGVAVFNKDGSMKAMDEIFTSLETKMKQFGNNDKAKTNYLEKIGLVDAQAKQAFMVLSSGSNKLKESMKAVNNSAGETQSAFEKAKNPMMIIQKIMSDLQYVALAVGNVLGFVLAPVFLTIGWIIGTVVDVFQWFTNGFVTGNPIVLLTAGVVGLLTLAFAAQWLWVTYLETATKRKIITDKLFNIWTAISTATINLFTASVELLTSAFFLVPLAIIAIIAAIAYLVYSVDGWGKAWEHTMKAAKLIIAAFVEGVKLYFNTLIEPFMMVIDQLKIAWLKFKDFTSGDDENAAEIANIKKAGQARIKALEDGAKKVKSLAIQSASEVVMAGNSLKSNGKTVGDMGNEIKAKLGFSNKIAAPTVPGMPPPVDTNAPSNLTDQGKKTNEATATGGTKHNYITISIKELIGLKTEIVTGGKDAATKSGNEVADELLRVLAMAITATG